MPRSKVNSKSATNGKKEAMDKLIKAIEENDPSNVEHVLKSKASSNISVLNFFLAMLKSIRFSQEDICHLIFDHAGEKFSNFKRGDLEEIILWDTVVKDVVYEAAQMKMDPLVKRLVTIIGANECLRFPRSPMLRAVAGDNPESVEVLIRAGIKPEKMFDMRYMDNSLIKEIVRQVVNAEKIGEEKKNIWKLLMPHFTARDVMSSRLLSSLIEQQNGGSMMLSGLDFLGLDFDSFLSSSNDEAKSIIIRVLNEYDFSTALFIFDHGFDVNSPIQENATTALHYTIGMLEGNFKSEAFDFIVEMIKRSADPTLKDNGGMSVEDLCVHKAKRYYKYDINPEGYVLLFKLLLRLGYILTEGTRSSILTMSSALNMGDLPIEIEQVPSLQCLCRKSVRSAQGSGIEDFMEKLDFPIQLKDFVLLRSVSWEEFELSEGEYYDEDYDTSDFYESGSDHSDWNYTDSMYEDDEDACDDEVDDD